LRARTPRAPITQIAPNAGERRAIGRRLRAGACLVQTREDFLHLREAFGRHQIGMAGDRAVGKLKRLRAVGFFDESTAAGRGTASRSFPCVNLQFMWRKPASLRFDSKHNQEGLTMIRTFALACALTFAASLVVQIAAVSQASAGKTCTYTSSDKKKGYKC
jgi:hypothetical protein